MPLASFVRSIAMLLIGAFVMDFVIAYLSPIKRAGALVRHKHAVSLKPVSTDVRSLVCNCLDLPAANHFA
jgi:hypothetical protein